MSVIPPRNLQPGVLTSDDYDRLAWEYYHSLPLEHFMESTPQSTQKQITASSFELLKERRDDLQYFSELLIQYPHHDHLQRVIPDFMVVLGASEIPARSNYALELEHEIPLMVHEYVSPSNMQKDYPPEEPGEVTSYVKYEQHLRVPYYLLFDPETQDLRVYHLDGPRYLVMEPNAEGRVRINELDVEIALHQRWVRFWCAGRLLPLPAELETQLQQVTQENTSLKGENSSLKSENTSLKSEVSSLKNENAVLSSASQASLQKSMERLRLVVVTLAQSSGRDDIVQLVSSADERQLEAWLDELQP